MLVFQNIKFNKFNMSCFWITHSPVVAVLFILPHALVADVDSTSCSPCYISTCLEHCLLKCPQKCPDKYYQTFRACETPTTTTKAPTTLKRTTTPTTATTTRTTTTTTPTTPTIMTAVRAVNETQHANIPPELVNVNRSRRQAPEGTTQEKPVIETHETTTQAMTITTLVTTAKTTTPTTSATTKTTTTLSTFTCRLCSLDSCILCKDDSQNKPVCAQCADGYSLSDDMASCSKDGLSGGAIAGIVIGAGCFMAAVAVGIFFLVRRFRLSKEGTDTEHARTTQSCADDPEQYEIGKLPDAPSPPAEDTSKRYDSLAPTNKDDPQSYSPFETRKESGYANCEGDPKNIYVNTQKGNCTGPSASEGPRARNNPEEKLVSADSVGLYEPIDTTRNRGDQGTYANAKAILGQHKNAAETEPTQADYYNDSGAIVENVYANP